MSDEVRTIIKEGLHRARVAAGVTQRDVREGLARLGVVVDLALVSKWERGVRPAPADAVAALAQVLGVPVADILDPRTEAEIRKGVPRRAPVSDPDAEFIGGVESRYPAKKKPKPSPKPRPRHQPTPAVEASTAPTAPGHRTAAVEHLVEHMAEPVEKPAVQHALAVGERSPREVIEESVEVVKRTADKLREKTTPAADAPFDPPPLAPKGAEPIVEAAALTAHPGYMRKIRDAQRSATSRTGQSVAASSLDHVFVTFKSQAMTVELAVPRGACVIAGGAEAFEQLEVSWS